MLVDIRGAEARGCSHFVAQSLTEVLSGVNADHATAASVRDRPVKVTFKFLELLSLLIDCIGW